MSTPDVSVVLAVYNTMPYLTRCLTSLMEQTIGWERLEVIAVDDGSTDGSGKELDRFARLYPGTVKVFHQANSGGPAVPSNRGLEHATGRYVFFVGADDYLGLEALERLVSAADRYGSDVVLGKLVGVNSRNIDQAIYARNETDIDLFNSALPWALSNTKLFRRELIERHKIRYPEDMPVGSDQPFTIEACLRAKRISVLADYEYYYAVRRLNARNITYRSRHEERLRCAESIMDFVAELIEPGPRRDAVLVRHFSWEVARLLEDNFLSQERVVQERVQAGVRRLADCYLTDRIRARLPVEARIRLLLAQQGTLDDLLAVIRQDAEHGTPPTLIEGDRWYAVYPGFRAGRPVLPDDSFDVTDAAAEWLARLDVTSIVWRSHGRDRVLVVKARSPRADLARLCSDSLSVRAGEVPGEVVSLTAGEDGTIVEFQLPVLRMIAEVPVGGGIWAVRAQVTALGSTGVAPVRSPRKLSASRQLIRRGARLYVVTPATSHRGQLVISVVPVTPRRVMARLKRGWRHGGK
ncbi:MAG TPA: glycosyltransferase [Micromonosporaceae bacterium]